MGWAVQGEVLIKLSTSTIYSDKASWLEARRHGIGGSDAPIIMGVNRWSSPYELACRKRGLLPEREQTEAMEMGQLIEPIAVEKLKAESGLKVALMPPFQIWRGDLEECSHMHSTIDAAACTQDESSAGVVEIKLTGLVPDKILEDPNSDLRQMWDTQLLHNMMVWNDTDWGIVAAILGGKRFRWYRLSHEDDPTLLERQNAIVKKTREFWEMLQRGELPEPDGSEATADALADRFPKDNGKAASLGPDQVIAFEEWERANKDISDAVARQRSAQNKLAAAIGKNTFAVLPNGVRLAYRTIERAGYTVKPTSFRKLERVAVRGKR